MIRSVRRLSLVHKKVFVTIVGILVLTLAVGTIMFTTIENSMRRQAYDRLDLAMAYAWESLGGPDAHGAAF